jgi:type IV pilus assembly protein PilC
MVYPLVLVCMAVCVLIFLLTFFIPRFEGIFKEFGEGLPALTKVIVSVSKVVGSPKGLWALAGIVIVGIALKRSFDTEAGKRTLERMLLRVPGVGMVLARMALVRFCRMLGTLIGAGVPLVASLRVAREALGNQTLSDAVSKSIEEVQRGEPLSKSLQGNPLLFPASVIEMVAVAEETGRLDKELVRLSIAYEAELERRLRMLVSLAEPLLLVVMAGVIGTVVVGMLLPVFMLQDLMK